MGDISHIDIFSYSVDFLALEPGIISRWFSQCQPETFGGAAVPGKKQSHEELESFMAWAPYIQQEFGVKNSDAYVNTHLDEQADPWFRACLFYRRRGLLSAYCHKYTARKWYLQWLESGKVPWKLIAPGHLGKNVELAISVLRSVKTSQLLLLIETVLFSSQSKSPTHYFNYYC